MTDNGNQLPRTRIGLGRRIVAGSPYVKTRLHDEHGNLIPISNLVRHLPRALVEAVARLTMSRLLPIPWLAYSGFAAIKAELRPNWRALEFGSGMSTCWLAEHCAFTLSIESDPAWYARINRQAASLPQDRLRYELRTGEDVYPAVSEEDAGEGFDFILVDGMWRDKCVENSLRYLRPGGVFYLDNSDWSVRTHKPGIGYISRARELALDYASTTHCSVRQFTDFSPGQLHVQQGLMIKRMV